MFMFSSNFFGKEILTSDLSLVCFWFRFRFRFAEEFLKVKQDCFNRSFLVLDSMTLGSFDWRFRLMIALLDLFLLDFWKLWEKDSEFFILFTWELLWFPSK